ncbi:MAG TPA: transglutaminase family protein [Chloroflexia bacterium]|nr:transglutaminase family protein [Chloroflexia bacterium]
MKVRIGCDFTYESDGETPMIFLVRPREQYNHTLLEETRLVEPEIAIHQYFDHAGNCFWRLTAPEGKLRLFYDAVAQVEPTPDPVLMELPGTLVQELPDEVLPYILPSRHCQSDLVLAEAWDMFGATTPGWSRVQAICDWIHSNITYGKGSTSNTSGYEAYQARRGVCRDFAHISIMLCRAMNIPARYVCGYLPDIGVPPDPAPMDFHAWFEAFVDGEWRTFDARHNIPRTGRVLIGQGRDAVDVAMTTIYGGSRLLKMRVWADEVPEDYQLSPRPVELKVS